MKIILALVGLASVGYGAHLFSKLLSFEMPIIYLPIIYSIWAGALFVCGAILFSGAAIIEANYRSSPKTKEPLD